MIFATVNMKPTHLDHMDINETEIMTEVAKTATKEAYNDLLHPSFQTVGEIVDLIPKTLQALCYKWRIWLYQSESNVKSIFAAIDEKMKNIPEQERIEPEPYVAMPALQNMSFCMDRKELREMYANLLTNSMYKKNKSEVHPSFVEIIKQMSPDEARILEFTYNNGHDRKIPALDVHLSFKDKTDRGFIHVLKKFSLIGKDAKCDDYLKVSSYLDNLERLGLIESPPLLLLNNKAQYERIKSDPYVKNLLDIPAQYRAQGHDLSDTTESFYMLTNLGKLFCRICIEEPVKKATDVTISFPNYSTSNNDWNPNISQR